MENELDMRKQVTPTALPDPTPAERRRELEEALLYAALGCLGDRRDAGVIRKYNKGAEIGSLDPYTDEEIRGIRLFLCELVYIEELI